MGDISILLKPRLWSLKIRKGSAGARRGWFKLLILGLIGTAFWVGVFLISLRVLNYFKGIEELGDILAFKLLSMMFIIFFSLLIFSGILTTLSNLYLSRDLFLVHAMPVSGYKIFIARWIESAIDSSWMVIVYSVPVLVAYAIVFKTGFFFYLAMLAALLFLSVISACFAAMFVMLAVIIVPASRMRAIFIFMGLTLFLVLYVAFRLLRPERLVDPEEFVTALIYLKALDTSASPFLPSAWAYDSLRASLTGLSANGFFHLALAGSFAGAIFCAMVLLAHRIYFKGFSRAQTAPSRFFKFKHSKKGFLRWFPSHIRAFAEKEIKSFFRDQTQWTQLLLIAALVIIYIYNFKVLPLERSPIRTVYLQNLLAFLNMGLAAFVLVAVTARFAFSAVSSEKEAFWIVKTAPIRIRTFLWIKFFIYFVPLLVLIEILIVSTNILLKVTPFMMVLSVTTIFFMVPCVVAMGIGFGAAFPDFKSENPAQAVTSFGGLLFMVVSAAYITAIIALEAGPVYRLFMSGFKDQIITTGGWIYIAVSFLLAFLLSLAAFWLPMRHGEKRLSGDW